MSEFDERIKSFQKSRDYVRDFFVFGFKSRNDFNEKSSRTYDNERRRLESWLGDYVRKDYVKKDSEEKDRVEKDCVKKGNKGAKKEKVANISLDIDSNMLDTNPLFKVYKAKSFTDNDIVLHFMILSLLQHSDEGESFTAEEITEFLNEKYGKVFEQQTVRRKCNAYLQEGLLASRKSGNKLKYYCDLSLYEAIKNIQGLADALKLFQFTDSLGIAASELLDCMDEENDVFRIKHSFFVFTLDDEVLLKIFHAINNKQQVELNIKSVKNKTERKERMVPLKIYVSSRSGRRYVCGFLERTKRFYCERLDGIYEVKELGEFSDFDKMLEALNRNEPNAWGVSFNNNGTAHIVKLSMTIKVEEPHEHYIVERIEREKRGGKLSKTADGLYLYEALVFDANEMVPWLRTFIGRIVDLKCSEKSIEYRFKRDLDYMYELYDIQ